MKAGRDPERIIRACEVWSAEAEHDTPYIPHAATWLNQERFEDILEERETTQQDNAGRAEERKRQMQFCVGWMTFRKTRSL